MVHGIDKFKAEFSQFSDQYVLIGGTACSLILEERNSEFRSTKDLDIVLVIEALKEDFSPKAPVSIDRSLGVLLQNFIDGILMLSIYWKIMI